MNGSCIEQKSVSISKIKKICCLNNLRDNRKKRTGWGWLEYYQPSAPIRISFNNRLSIYDLLICSAFVFQSFYMTDIFFFLYVLRNIFCFDVLSFGLFLYHLLRLRKKNTSTIRIESFNRMSNTTAEEKKQTQPEKVKLIQFHFKDKNICIKNKFLF